MFNRRMWLAAVIVSATAAVVVGVTVAYLVGQKDGNPLYIRGMGFLSVGTLTVVAVSCAAMAAVA
jgi:membrane protein DedA with SNARE-associated domain